MPLDVVQHWLRGAVADQDVDHDPTDGKDSGAFTGDRPDTIVIHYTAGSTLSSAVDTLKDPDLKASAHLVIDRDGHAVQLIAFDRIAWHAGTSHWRGRTGLNRFSIGIELVNAGELKPSGGRFLSWFGKAYGEDEVIEAVHRNQSVPAFWHTYMEPQIGACFDVCRALRDAYPIEFILGHEEIAPERKIDPGPAFPLDRLRDRVLVGRSDMDETGSGAVVEADTLLFPGAQHAAVVTAGRLNFRTLPHAGAELAHDPLPRGQRVEVLERSGDWRRVRVIHDGWVHGDYLKEGVESSALGAE